MRATLAGVIMGTAAYMSPEQARGQLVDKRADIWSFGVVLYELLTGKPLFDGGTVSDTLAAVLRQDLDLNAVPPRFRKLLQKCLTRDPRQRLRDITGAHLLLEQQPTQPATAARTTRWQFAIAAAATLAAAVAGLGWFRSARPSPPKPLLRLQLEFDKDAIPYRLSATRIFALSPDGTRVAISYKAKDGKVQLGIRNLSETSVTPLPGTEDARSPIFSPDGEWLAFSSGDQLMKISLNGGTPVAVGPLSTMRGADWSPDGTIYGTTAGSKSEIYRISADGGTPSAVTKMIGEERTHRWPHVLPGGEALLFTSHISTNIGGYDEADIDVLQLKTGVRKNLLHGGFDARFVRSTASSGYLLYLHKDTVLAAPFDLRKLALTGPPVPMVPNVFNMAVGGGEFDISESGTFVFHEAEGGHQWPILSLDASGKISSLHGVNGNYTNPRFSPDGKRIAFAAANGHGGDLWVEDLERAATSRLTALPGSSLVPRWSPNGKGIFFSVIDQPQAGLYWVPSDGSGEPMLLLRDSTSLSILGSISPDSKFLFLIGGDRKNILRIPVDWNPSGRPHAGQPEALIHNSVSMREPEVSPDGRWIAYSSAETGRPEIYVRRLPDGSGRLQVSTSGGTLPVWSPHTKELFYQDRDLLIQVVAYTASGDLFQAAKPRPFSQARVASISAIPTFDVAPDGTRLAFIPLVNDGAGGPSLDRLTFLVNFTDELRRRVGEGR